MNDIVKRNERGALIIISGPSGCGKGTLISEYLKRHDNAWLSISCTSRAVRPGDVENETYYFISEEEFKEKIDNDVYYAKNISFALDVKIFFKTIKTVVCRDNVNVTRD